MNEKKVLLLVGPESSGTRILVDVLSQHPSINGSSDAVETHRDSCDDAWRLLEKGDETQAGDVVAELFETTDMLVTRRSLPHGSEGAAAEYLRFPDLDAFLRLSFAHGWEVVVLLTYRSAVPNLMSWTQKRQSVQGNFEHAVAQYHAAYRHVFNVLNKYQNVSFYFISVDSLVLDGEPYMESIYQLLGLPSYRPRFVAKEDANKKWYGIFLKAKGRK
ncbi:MAG: hypothetical protein WDZ75_01775 [Candidatus Paceibacterota bacterium]